LFLSTISNTPPFWYVDCGLTNLAYDTDVVKFANCEKDGRTRLRS
jgi:hypothetical protein